MMKSHLYHVDIRWKKGRTGEISSPELSEKIEIATPPQFTGGAENIWSPEHLFTAAATSCLMTTFLAIAENSGLEFTHFSCGSAGKLEMTDGKYLMTEIHLKPEVTITSEKDRLKAERILNKAAASCLISNSMKSTITVTPDIMVAAEKIPQ